MTRDRRVGDAGRLLSLPLTGPPASGARGLGRFVCAAIVCASVVVLGRGPATRRSMHGSLWLPASTSDGVVSPRVRRPAGSRCGREWVLSAGWLRPGDSADDLVTRRVRGLRRTLTRRDFYYCMASEQPVERWTRYQPVDGSSAWRRYVADQLAAARKRLSGVPLSPAPATSTSQ